MEKDPAKKITNIDEYIDRQPENIRATLEILRQTIHKAAPDAEEVISYQMPAFKFHGILVYFAAFKNHYSLFAMPKAIQEFKTKLKPYEFSKGTIRFPQAIPVPIELITEIIEFKVRENLAKARLKASTKNKKINTKIEDL
jgi:uncharacterized protein YdhG (YjbR/CyaY superfamily)